MQETPTIPWQTLKTKTHQKPPVQEVLEEYARSFTEVYEKEITAYVTRELIDLQYEPYRDDVIYIDTKKTRSYNYYFHVVNRYKGNKSITLFQITMESPSSTIGVFYTSHSNNNGILSEFNSIEEMKNIINDNITNNPGWENTIFQLATNDDDLPF